jgi:hypothetical protein
MQKQIARELKTEAQRVAERFSNPKREGNPTAETFEIQEIIPLSDDAAVVYFKKNNSKDWNGFLLLHQKRFIKRLEIFLPY